MSFFGTQSKMTLQDLIEKYSAYQIEMRRYFHQHPEESTKEVKTAERIREELDKAGIPWRVCGMGTGTLARIEGKLPGKTIMLSGDIDALSVTEKTGLPFASENEGVMHACGHDCHISMLLTAARMLNDGVDACFGMHVWADYPAGTVGIRKGPTMASGDKFTITVKGKSTHGAQPHHGTDALVMAASIVMNLQTMVSREFSPIDTAVVTVGKLTSGTRFNVVAGDAVMEGTTRTFSKEIRDSFAERITRIAKCTAEAMRGTAEVNYEYLVPVTTNDPKICDLAAEAVTKIFGEGKVVEAEQTMGGEDFAYYQEKIPGAMVFLGIRNPACNAVYPQHHMCYTVDESVLVKGAALHTQTALNFLGVELK